MMIRIFWHLGQTRIGSNNEQLEVRASGELRIFVDFAGKTWVMLLELFEWKWPDAVSKWKQ
jgi:hypothetical protein